MKIIKEINKMSNILFAWFWLNFMLVLVLLVCLIMTVMINDDLVKKIKLLEYENKELTWELSQVDQMICNNDINDYNSLFESYIDLSLKCGANE